MHLFLVINMSIDDDDVYDVNHDDDDDGEVDPSVYIPGVAQDLEWEAS